jgi:hypothetical protein
MVGFGNVVEHIDGGFAAISGTKSRRIRISLDRGETWQANDKGLPPLTRFHFWRNPFLQKSRW